MNFNWQVIATTIIRNRILILIVLALFTGFMWTQRGKKISQTLVSFVHEDDPVYLEFLRFKEVFGDDANTLIVSVDVDLARLENFKGLYELGEELKQADAVTGVINYTGIFDLIRQDSPASFLVRPVAQQMPETQAEVDSFIDRINNLPFYRDLLYKDSSQVSLVMISLDPDRMNTADKVPIVGNLLEKLNAFSETYDVELHVAGLPIIRYDLHQTVVGELYLFLVLALLVTGITLLLFFRSLSTTIFPLIVVGSVIIFSMGLIGLMDYEISLITGIIPALVTVISIPNSVYLITKYHIEFLRTRNKMKSLILVIEKIGIVTVMTNATTAIGLGVLAFTDIQPLKEFGVVAGLSVIAAFFISLLLIPIVFSFLPSPRKHQTRHLQRRGLSVVIKLMDNIVLNHRWAVFGFTFLLLVLSIVGMFQIKPVSFMADDLPQDSYVMKDLRYIEVKFIGAVPFEFVVEDTTNSRRGVLEAKTLQRISRLQDSLATYPDVSKSLSIADFAKFFRQAYYAAGPETYDLPSRTELGAISGYLQTSNFANQLSLSRSLIDSSQQVTRITGSIRDIGSIRIEELSDSIQQDIDEIFPAKRYKTSVTGTTRIFVKANDTLIESLLQSLAIAFGIIALLMGLLFRSTRMVFISLIPNFLPLLMVAGVMGFTGIALKPSTALVFGVAFGVAVDDSIHFLARYRLARRLGDSVRRAVSNSFKDTGVSMIYTSMILFFGFVAFMYSSFGGTQSLGLLTSMTLGIAMFSNLIFLPALLITFD
ncbi:MAG: MMPL family transporter, partial [Bacteroidota bacterium]